MVVGRLSAQEIRIEPGGTNAVVIGDETALYALPAEREGIERLLLTDAWHDRYVAPPADTELVVPAALAGSVAEPERVWAAREASQFHDYAQDLYRLLPRAHGAVRAVVDGDRLSWSGGELRVLHTPGRARGAVSYLAEIGGERVAFTGALFHGAGQLLDLYSLQGPVPEADARGYHGYAAHAGELVKSLRRVLEWDPTLVVPSYGEVIVSPTEAIGELVERLESLLTCHFETDALLWYWGIENHWIRSREVVGQVAPMPTAELRQLPDHIVEFGTSRLLLSQTGEGFLIDAGDPLTLPTLRSLRATGAFSSLAGLWITHYHDDHCDYANVVTTEFDCHARFIDAMGEVLAHPGSFCLPCLPSQPVNRAIPMRDSEVVYWNEWRLTAEYFPGQTLYHGGLLATREDGGSYYFTGDSFTPTGIDDYCMHNRNLYGKDYGYERCLRRLLELPDTWLINQHVKPMFRFSTRQLRQMSAGIARRASLLREMSPWPTLNSLVDPSWASIVPFRATTRVNDEVALELRVRNDETADVSVALEWYGSDSLELLAAGESLRVRGSECATVRISVRPRTVGLHAIVGNLLIDGVPRRVDALVRAL